MSSKSSPADLSCCLQAIEACWTGLMPSEGRPGSLNLRMRTAITAADCCQGGAYPSVLCGGDLGQVDKIGQHGRIVDVQVLLQLALDSLAQRLQPGVCQLSVARALHAQ